MRSVHYVEWQAGLSVSSVTDPYSTLNFSHRTVEGKHMLSKLYRTLPPGGVWLLASAALFALGSLGFSGSGARGLSALGIAGALLAVLIVLAFSDRGAHPRR